MALESNDDDHAIVEDVKPTIAPTRFSLGNKQMSMKKTTFMESTDSNGSDFSR